MKYSEISVSCYGHQAVMLQMPRTPGVKSASSPPRANSVPRGSKSTTFAKGILQLFNLRKIVMNPTGILPFYPLNIRYAYKTKLKFEKFGLEVGVL